MGGGPPPPGARGGAGARAELSKDARDLLGCCYLLSQDPEPEVRDVALQTLRGFSTQAMIAAVNQQTHAKLLEFLAVLRSEEPELDSCIYRIRNANDRTVIMIAARANADVCEQVAYGRERLVMTPQVFVSLYDNPACDDKLLEKAAAFLRMNRVLPELDRERFAKAGAAPNAALDLEAEIEAALAGEQSPTLQARAQENLDLFDLDAAGEDDDLFQGFEFDFTDDLSSFSWDLTEDRDGPPDEEEKQSMHRKMATLTVGQKVRLAHIGNKEVRSILIRDRNKQVSLAVVKSGRLTDGEVKALAGNRNIEDEVLREVATNREWLRKYPVKVALVNNPKCPVSVGVGLVSGLQKRDMQELTRNHNVSSVIRQTAQRMFRQRFRGESKKKSQS